MRYVLPLVFYNEAVCFEKMQKGIKIMIIKYSACVNSKWTILLRASMNTEKKKAHNYNKKRFHLLLLLEHAQKVCRLSFRII